MVHITSFKGWLLDGGKKMCLRLQEFLFENF